jgi:hypothetical protein
MRPYFVIAVLLVSGSASAFGIDAESLGRSVTADGSYGYYEYYNDSDGSAAGDWSSGVSISGCSPYPWEPCSTVLAAFITSIMPASGSYESYTLSFDLDTFKSDQVSFEEDNARASLGLQLTFDQAVRYDFTALCATGARNGSAAVVPGSSSISGDFGSCANSGSGILDAGTYQIFSSSSGSAYADYSVTFSAVPIPAAVWLFGSALAGLGWMRRKQTA